MKSSNASKRPLWVRLAIVAGGLYVLYILFGFFGVPRIVKSVLEGRVAETLDREIALEKASFNPFTLSVEMIGLNVEDDQGESFVDVGRVFVNAQLFPLITRRVSVKEFSLSDTTVSVALDEDGVLNIDRLLQSSEPESVEEESEPFHFTVGLIDVDNVRIEVADYTRTLPLEETIGPLTFVAENLKSDIDSDSPYSFNAKIGDQTEIEWSGDVSVNPVASSGSFRIENLDISKAKPLWHDSLRAEIAGAFSMAGSYGVELTAEKETAYLESGSMTLEGFLFDDPEEDTRVAFSAFAMNGMDARWPENRLVVESVTLSEPTALVVRDEAGEVSTPIRPANVAVSPTKVAEAEDAETLEVDVLVKSFQLESGSVGIVDRAVSNDVVLSVANISLQATNIAPFDESVTAQLELGFLLNDSGQGQLTAETNLPNQSATGEFTLDGLELATFQGHVALYSNARIESGSLALDSRYQVAMQEESIDVGVNLTVQSVGVGELESGDPVVSLESVAVEDLKFDGEALKIAGVRVGSPELSIVLEEEGVSLSRLTKSDGESGSDVETAKVESDSEGAFAIELGEFEMSGGQISVVDKTLDTSHALGVTDLELRASNVSSAPGKQATVALSGGFDRGGSFEFSGNLEPLDFKSYSDLRLDLSSFDLSSTAPYWRKYLGRDLDKGMLNVDASIAIDSNILEGTNGILIDQLTLGEKVESEDSLGLPIGLAVAIMKDRQGKMDLPPLKLSGDLDDPSVSISGIVMKALGNIIVKIATSPFAALGGLAGGGGKEDLSVTPFSAGAFQLEPSALSQLDKMAKILDERPGLKVQLATSLDDAAETLQLRRALIANADGAVTASGPVAVLQGYSLARFREQAESVYRELKGIPLVAENAVADGTVAENEAVEPMAEESGPEPEKRGLLGNVAQFFKNVTGQNKEANEPLPEAEIEGATESADVGGVAVSVVLPAFEQIEKELLELPRFQPDPSWLDRLAQARASLVKDYLVTTKGIDASRVFISGASDSENAGSKSAVTFELTD